MSRVLFFLLYFVSLDVCIPINTDTAAYCFMFLLYSLSRYECLAVQYDCFSSQSVESRALNKLYPVKALNVCTALAIFQF